MADWRSIRASLEHENQLVNYRFTWLLTFETLLFGSLGVGAKEIASSVRKASVDDLWLYCFALAGFVNTGIIAALYVERFIRAAENAHEISVIWWYKKYSDKFPSGSIVKPIEMNIDSDNPPLCGGPSPITSLRGYELSDIVAKLMRQSRFPLVFVLAWLGFNYVVLVYLNLAKYKARWGGEWTSTLSRYSWWLAVLLPMFLLIFWAVVYHLQRQEFNKYLGINTKNVSDPDSGNPAPEETPPPLLRSPEPNLGPVSQNSVSKSYKKVNQSDQNMDRNDPPDQV
jgi:hypothetical protein